jgi:hypothetical protein
MSFIEEARNELKRADHQIFVSLKYTRTADVLRNILERFIACSDYIVEALLLKKEQSGEIFEIPVSPVSKVNEVRRLYSDALLTKMMERYIFYRKLMNSSYRAINEFRRHVAMISEIDGQEVEVNIDNISEYYEEMKEFVKYIEGNYDLDFEKE